jgi:hypothetical protein
MSTTVTEGFLSRSQLENVQVGTDPEALLLSLAAQLPLSGARDDFSRV